MDKQLELLDGLTQLLTEANASIPTIFATVSAVSLLIKGVTGTAPPLSVIADRIEAQLGTNDAAIRARIARLKAELGDEAPQ